MKNYFNPIGLLALCIGISACTSQKAVYQEISRDEIHDKVSGAWAGKMIGVMYGREMEFKALGEMYEDNIPWEAQMVEKSLLEDDIYVQLSFMMAMEEHGLDASEEKLAEVFAHAEFPLCHANLQARKNYLDGIKPPMSGTPEFSMHADDIDFQIESDFLGFIHPGMTQSSNKMCDRIGRIMAYGDGLYGGMFVSAMHTLAYFENDVEKIVKQALTAIPSESAYAECIRDVLEYHRQYPDDWKRAWQFIQNKWGEDDICIPFHAFNIDAKFNGAFIAIGLLYGKGDFEQSMEIAIRCGQDTDCNSANVAAVLGIINGYSGIPDRLKSHIPEIADSNFLHTTYSYKKAVDQTIAFIDETVVANGGKVEADHYTIKVQEPLFEGSLEQSYPGMAMAYQVEVEDSLSWNFGGQWGDFVYGDGDPDLFKLATTPGDSCMLEFKGTGISLLGSWNTSGGRADIYVDGRLVKQIDTYHREEAGKYDVNRAHIFHVLGLPDGEHRIKLVVSDDKNPRSSGHNIWLQRALIYANKTK